MKLKTFLKTRYLRALKQQGECKKEGISSEYYEGLSYAYFELLQGIKRGYIVGGVVK